MAASLAIFSKMNSLSAVKQVSSGPDWATLAAIAAAFVAIVALIFEARRTRRQLGIDNMWRLIERWDQPLLRSIRAKGAKDLLADFDSRKELPPEAREVLNHFELLAYLVVSSKTLPVEDAWVNLSAFAIAWWDACRPGVEVIRSDDPTIYEELVKLAEEFRKYEEKRGLQPWRPSENELKRFLEGEASIEEEQRGPQSRWRWFRQK